MNRRHFRHFLAALATAAVLAGAAAARDYSLAALTIGHPYAIETPATATAGAGYLSITNGGPEPDRLLAVRSAFPRTLVHSVVIDAQGVASMHPVDGLEIPPGETVTLAPQGLHVMFMGLRQPFVAGTGIPATLVFERAGEVAVEFEVEPRSGVPAASH